MIELIKFVAGIACSILAVAYMRVAWEFFTRGEEMIAHRRNPANSVRVMTDCHVDKNGNFVYKTKMKYKGWE